MTVLSAQSVRKRWRVIHPFVERGVAFGMSYGVGPAGYDVRTRDSRLLWPKGSALVDTLEVFDVDTDLKLNVQDKSTWARRFVTVQNTTAEPGWRGILRVELTNHSWRFHRIRAGMPIAQIEFNLLDEPTDSPYAGKYQDQQANQNAIMEGDQPRRRLLWWLFHR